MKAATCRIPALIAAGLMLACLGVVAANGAAVPSAASEEVSYEDFIRFGLEERQARFAQFSAETRSALKREHATRWLARNAGQISPGQEALIREAIAFFSPELYRGPPSAALRQQEADLKRRLECSLGRAQLIEAFAMLGPQPLGPQPPRTWDDRVLEWLSWFSDCVVR